MNNTQILKSIAEFEKQYNYDASFMRALLEYSANGYAKFNDFMPMSHFREKTTPEAFFWQNLQRCKPKIAELVCN